MTKIPSVEERAGELWRCIKHDFEKEGIELPNSWNGIGMAYGGYARAIEALTADRTAILTELREWVEIKKLDTTLMNVANRKRAGHINRTLVEIKAHINNLINPNSV